MLKKTGIIFDVLITEANEVVDYYLPPVDFVILISKRKIDVAIQKIKQRLVIDEKEVVIIAADTIVTIDGKILGKPKDFSEAFEMLKLLQGNRHKVFTGLAVAFVKASNLIIVQDHCCTDVYMKALNDKEIINYINSEEPFDKAGAYAIQGAAAKFIEKIEGDYNNVVGLPVDLLLRILKSRVEVNIDGKN